jgi:hypothetical protein
MSNPYAQPPTQQPQYQQPYYQAPPQPVYVTFEPQEPFNYFALFSMISGLVTYFLCCFFSVAFIGPFFLILGIAPIILGGIGLKKANESPTKKGKGLAVSGLIMGIVSLVLLITIVVLIALGINYGVETGFFDSVASAAESSSSYSYL